MRTYTSGVEGQMCLDLERPSGEGGKRSVNEMQIKIESPGLSSEYPEYSEILSVTLESEIVSW